MDIDFSPITRFLGASLALLALILCACAQEDGDHANLILATATPGGTYYPVGVAVGTLLTEKLAPEISASAINSAGSGENLHMLNSGEAQLAILQGLFGLLAYEGKGPYEGRPIQNFRSITMLWQNVEHFLLARRHGRSGMIQDLRNLKRKYSIGKRGSGTEGSTRAIFSALRLDPEVDVISEFLGYSPSAQAMMDGRITGASIPAGPPVAAVTQVFAQMGADNVIILSFSDEQLDRVRAEYPVWSRYKLAAGTYPGQVEAVQTIAQPNFLACRADLPEDVVYRITRTIHENLEFLREIHKATEAISLESATRGLTVPLHPGAVRYYIEKGIQLP